jgi:hypothetical protein
VLGAEELSRYARNAAGIPMLSPNHPPHPPIPTHPHTHTLTNTHTPTHTDIMHMLLLSGSRSHAYAITSSFAERCCTPLQVQRYTKDDTIVVFGVGPGDGKEQLVVATACSDTTWSGYVQQQLAEATLCLLTISIPFPNQDLRFCFAALNTSRSPSTLS